MNDKDPGDRRRRLDSVIPELIKRAVEIGVEKAVEAPDNIKELVGGMKLPRDAAHYLLGQIEETKNGLWRAVANEVRDFLEQTNVSSEMQKMLTTVQFEISTTIRFRPNENAGASPKPEVKADVQMRRAPRPADRPETVAASPPAASPPAAASPPVADDRSRERRKSRE